MTTLQLQWESKQEEIFMLQETDTDNSELISSLELEIHELMRQDWESQNK